PGDCLVPNGVATLGFALPAALAASLTADAKRVVAIGAAAGFDAMAAEWATAARLAAPIVAIALNHTGTTDVASAARAAGVDVVSAAAQVGYPVALERAWRAARPALVDAHVGR